MLQIDSLRNRSIFEQQRLLLETTRKLSDGIMGGKTFAKTTLERKPKYKKEEAPTDLFDRLEKKYGKINVNRKEVPRTDQVEVNRKEVPRTEQVEVNREEVPRIKQVDVSNNNCLMNEKYDKSQVKAELYKLITQKEYIGETDVKDTNVLKETDKKLHKLITENDNIRESIVDEASNVVEITESDENLFQTAKIFNEELTETLSVDSIKDTVSNMDDSKVEKQQLHNSSQSESVIEYDTIDVDDDGGSINNSDSYNFSKTDATNSRLNANIIEKSHQSGHLAHILSKPPLQEFSNQSQDSLEDNESDSDWAVKVSQIQEAVKAAQDNHGWAGFDEVFLTSALDGSGINILQVNGCGGNFTLPLLFSEIFKISLHKLLSRDFINNLKTD